MKKESILAKLFVNLLPMGYNRRENNLLLSMAEINTFFLTNPVLPAVGDATGLLSDMNISPDNSDRTPYNFYLQSSKSPT